MIVPVTLNLVHVYGLYNNQNDHQEGDVIFYDTSSHHFTRLLFGFITRTL